LGTGAEEIRSRARDRPRIKDNQQKRRLQSTKKSWRSQIGKRSAIVVFWVLEAADA
jgi:hypothetical protein